MQTPQEILSFWFGDDPGHPLQNSAKWWKKAPAFDAEIDRLFRQDMEAAARGELDSWRAEPRPCLALILLLDQFSRNVHRNQPESFAQDSRALEASLAGQAQGLDRALTIVERWFFCMPMMHAEDREIQRRSVATYRQLAAGAPPELAATMRGALDFAEQHAGIVERFGRFPHRNAILGRSTTVEEAEFLKQPGSSF